MLRCLVTSGTATNGEDYRLTTSDSVLTVQPGEASTNCEVEVIGDTTDEEDETIEVRVLTSDARVDQTNNTGTGTILDDDEPPSVSVADASGPEGGTITFTASLSEPSERQISVKYTASVAAGDTAILTDFTARSGTLIFEAGDVEKTFNVRTTLDTLNEPSETFTVTLTEQMKVTVSDATATGTITDVDSSPGATIPPARGKVLVSNIAQSLVRTGPQIGEGLSQLFSTRTMDEIVRSVEIVTVSSESIVVGGTTTPNNLSFSAAIYRVNRWGYPDVVHTALAAPESFPAGIAVHEFTAPLNSRLEANKGYAIRISPGSGEATIGATLSRDTDPGAPQWSIADGYDVWDESASSWRSSRNGESLRIRINGSLGTQANDAGLSELTLASDTTAITLTPAFSIHTNRYTTRVSNQVSTITVTALPHDGGGSYELLDENDTRITDADSDDTNGHQISLSVGTNTIRVKVTGEDTTTTRIYTVTVNRAPTSASTDTALSGLALTVEYETTEIGLTPTFEPDTTAYSAAVRHNTGLITFTVTPNHSGASFVLLHENDEVIHDQNGTKAGEQLHVTRGVNTIKVRVTAEDNVETEIYTVVVTRGGPSDDITGPEIETATVNTKTLVLSYDEPLDEGSVPAGTAYTVNVNDTAVTSRRRRSGRSERQDGNADTGRTGSAERDGDGELHSARDEPGAGRSEQRRRNADRQSSDQ